MNRITANTIKTEELIQSVLLPESGAVNVFVGTTRNHSGGRKVVALEYEAYEPMATKMMSEIENEARARWQIHNVAIVHRVGRVEIGEASVVIAVSSAHRDEAFHACRFIIDKLKEVVPIWKKEFFADGTVEWKQQKHEEHVKL